MKDKTERIQFEDLPQDLLKDIDNKIIIYSVGLVGAGRTNLKDEFALIGSGTLIEIEGRKGILTAHHVITELKKYTQLGLSLLPYEHRYAIPTNHLSIIEVAKPYINSIRPDLSVIILPETSIGRLLAHKSFWNISRWRENVLLKPVDPVEGVWIVYGFPAELTTNKIPTKGFEEIKSYHSICGYAPIEKYYEEEEFDYLDVSVSYMGRVDLPQSFGGLSGGGLWQAPFFRSEHGELQNRDPILAGMAFYQTDIKENKRYIICHGRNSIYKIVYNKIVESKSWVDN